MAGDEAAGEEQETVGLADEFGLPCPGTRGEVSRDPQGGWQGFPVRKSLLAVTHDDTEGHIATGRLGPGS